MKTLQVPEVRENEPLSLHTTFKIGGPARYFSLPKNRAELAHVLKWAAREGLPWMLLGNGSNMLFPDKGYAGVIISLKEFAADFLQVEGTRVRVSAGMGLIRLANLLAENNLSGMEFISTIPGTVGGGLAMNAGYSRAAGKKNELSDFLISAEVLNADGSFTVIEKKDMIFSYRKSSLAGKTIIEAVFELESRPKEEILNEIRANSEYRRSVQDLKSPSAGSVFKNPEKGGMSAGKLIDAAGLRGQRSGGAEISEKHANFIVNRGQATAEDVIALIRLAQKTVKEKFNVDLELEIKVIT